MSPTIKADESPKEGSTAIEQLLSTSSNTTRTRVYHILRNIQGLRKVISEWERTISHPATNDSSKSAKRTDKDTGRVPSVETKEIEYLFLHTAKPNTSLPIEIKDLPKKYERHTTDNALEK